MTVLETQELYLLEYLNQIDKDKTASIFDVEKYVADKKWTKDEARNIIISFYNKGFFEELNSENLSFDNRCYALNDKGRTYYYTLRQLKATEKSEASLRKSTKITMWLTVAISFVSLIIAALTYRITINQYNHQVLQSKQDSTSCKK